MICKYISLKSNSFSNLEHSQVNWFQPVLFEHTKIGSSDEAVTPPYRETKFETVGIIIGSVVAVLFLGFCLVDVLCCKMNDSGNRLEILTNGDM